MGYGNIREEELKNKVAADFFSKYDGTQIIGNIDFCIAQKTSEINEPVSLLWAEAKKGTRNDLWKAIVQLILTIGKARTFDKFLPPHFLGAFDADKIVFIPYSAVHEVFYQNDFNWNVAPSDQTSNEFQYLLNLIQDKLKEIATIFSFIKDEKVLKKFIRHNFSVGRNDASKLNITKNNFVSVYLRWREIVAPQINIDWVAAKQESIYESDFYLADILSQYNYTLKDKLNVLLKNNKYSQRANASSIGDLWHEYEFLDGQKAHRQFWNRYNRPPKNEYWDYIIERRDLLVPQDVRERKGSFFTPQIWVEKSQEYLAISLGENWQDEYVVWDCAAGTGNLLAGLTNKYNIWASTLDLADVDVMKDRIKNGASMLESHVFQFDFLNGDFSDLPNGLQEVINDEERRKKLVIYINPPYAEAASKSTITQKGCNKSDVAVKTVVYRKYQNQIGLAGRELFAQFLFRIFQELNGVIIAQFSKLKIVQAPAFDVFRMHFQAKILSSFLVPAYTFDNVKGKFPIGFFASSTVYAVNHNSLTLEISGS